MKKYILLSSLLVMVFISQAQVINDPHAELRELKGFSGIRMSGSFDVYLTQDQTEAVAVSAASEEVRQRIITSVKDGVLYLSFDGDKKFWKNWKNDKMQLKAYISFKQLNQLGVSGACDVYLQGTIKLGDLKIAMSGASDIRASGRVEAEKLVVQLSGASDAEMTGQVKSLNVEASGASDFKGFDLTTDYCEAHASGASSIRITVNKELSAHASGASDVKYKGEGAVKDSKSSGASTISRKS
jgi:Putative auto-transporter adhesin, head GIN domain